MTLFLIPARSIQNSESAHTACEYLGMDYTSLILCREYRHFIQRRNDTQVFVYYNIMQDTLNTLIGVSPSNVGSFFSLITSFSIFSSGKLSWNKKWVQSKNVLSPFS
jgi:hypothetical protein